MPPANKTFALPTTSPTTKPVISNEPPSETKTAESISASPASWDTSIVKSVKVLHVLSDVPTVTVGEKSIHDI